jgi:hypothetical protein
MAISDIMGLLGRAGESIGGGTPSIYGGLLSEDELRAAKNRASTKALFDLSAAMAEAGRPQSGRPINTFGALAKGLSAAQQGYQSTLQQQAKEKMAMQEMQRQLESQKRAANVQKLIGGAFQPAQAGQAAQPAPYLAGAPYGKAMPEIPATPAKFDLQAIAPQLMQTAEGRAALNDLMNAQKAMQGEAITLAPDATLVRMGLGGQPEVLATGAPKMSDLERQYAFAKTPQGGSYAGTFEQFKAISAPKTTISMGGDKALADTVGKDIGSMMGPATEQARVAMETITNAGNIESALDKAITGPAADVRTTLLRVGQSLGVAGKDANEILANTQILVQGLAKSELQAAEAMKGQGQITENERAIIKKASAGTQNMTPAEIKASLIAIRKVAENKIKRQQTLLQQFKSLPNVEKYAPFYELPAYTPTMGGSTQNSLQQMLDEEAKKRGL